MRAFSQYLMRDDLPRPGRPYLRYGGFESGLRHSGGERKLAYDGFRLAFVARRVGHRHVRTSLWGLVRPATGRTTVSIEYRNRGYVAVAHAQARPHRRPRLLVDDDELPPRALLPRALAGAGRR